MHHYPYQQRVASWPVLNRGDIVDVIAPASACRRSELNGAIKWLKAQGFQPRVPINIFSRGHATFAQTDEVRFAHLKRALLAEDSKAIWCVRGGYGALRLMPQLARIKKPKFAKIIVGYSDITTLHSYFNGAWAWPTLHGPLLDRFGRKANRTKETREVLALLRGTLEDIRFAGLSPVNSLARKKRKIRGPLVGGNIAVLQSSLGTKYAYRPQGHIVFFEDIGERPHRLDRMLTQFLQAGYFERARAVVFGSLLVNDVKDRRLIYQDVLPRFASALKIPVLTGLPCGHGKVQRPLPLLTNAQLELGSNPKLTVYPPSRR